MELVLMVLLRVARAVLWPVVRVDRWLSSLWDKLDYHRAHRLALACGTRVRITCPDCNGVRSGHASNYDGEWVIDYFSYDPGDYHLVRTDDFQSAHLYVQKSTYAGRDCIEVLG